MSNQRVIEMEIATPLTMHSFIAAVEIINATEADDRKKGVDFVELVIGPSVEDFKTADVISHDLLRKGMGVKLSLFWPFKGSSRWAVQTDKTRVVNAGM